MLTTCVQWVPAHQEIPHLLSALASESAPAADGSPPRSPPPSPPRAPPCLTTISFGAAASTSLFTRSVRRIDPCRAPSSLLMDSSVSGSRERACFAVSVSARARLRGCARCCVGIFPEFKRHPMTLNSQIKRIPCIKTPFHGFELPRGRRKKKDAPQPQQTRLSIKAFLSAAVVQHPTRG